MKRPLTVNRRRLASSTAAFMLANVVRLPRRFSISCTVCTAEKMSSRAVSLGGSGCLCRGSSFAAGTTAARDLAAEAG